MKRRSYQKGTGNQERGKKNVYNRKERKPTVAKRRTEKGSWGTDEEKTLERPQFFMPETELVAGLNGSTPEKRVQNPPSRS